MDGQPELSALLDRYLDGVASTEDIDRLSQLLASDSNARSTFWDVADFDHLLEVWGDKNWLSQSAEIAELVHPDTISRADLCAGDTAPFSRSNGDGRLSRLLRSAYGVLSRPMAISLFASGLFTALTLLTLAFWVVPDWKRAAPPDGISATEFVARISRVSDAIFDKTSDGHFKHRLLVAGENIVVNSGLVEVAFNSGSIVTLHGPCEFIVEGRNIGSFTRGKLAANVPRQAIGFQVNTPFATVTDLGTEFGVEVSADMAQVAVYQGEVRMKVVEASSSPRAVYVTAGGLATVDRIGKLTADAHGAERLAIQRRIEQTNRNQQAAAGSETGETGENLIRNPGFEMNEPNMAPTHWKHGFTPGVQGTVMGIAPRSGARQYQFQNMNVNLDQTVTVSEQGAYELSMWIANRDSPQHHLAPVGPNGARLELLDASGQRVESTSEVSADYDTPRGQYVQWQRQYNHLPAGRYTVRVSNGRGTGANQCMVDDFSLRRQK